MAARDKFRSRLVAWLKILLPLAALGILSTLFLFSRTIDPTRAIPYAKVDVKKLAREPQITAPNYAGVTADGTAISVTAAKAKPGTGGTQGASASDVTATLEGTDGKITTADAAEGTIDPAGGVMTLIGGVTINTPAGYNIDTEALTLLLNRTHLQSAGAVTAEGPLGRIEAGSMVLDRAGGPADKKAPYVLVFNGGVKLVYQPAKKGN